MAAGGIKRGDVLRIRPEWQDPGDDDFTWVAVEDEDGGRVRISALMDTPIVPSQVVTTAMVEHARSETRKGDPDGNPSGLP